LGKKPVRSSGGLCGTNVPRIEPAARRKRSPRVVLTDVKNFGTPLNDEGFADGVADGLFSGRGEPPRGPERFDLCITLSDTD
jgi:hypothetical protein